MFYFAFFPPMYVGRIAGFFVHTNALTEVENIIPLQSAEEIT